MSEEHFLSKIILGKECMYLIPVHRLKARITEEEHDLLTKEQRTLWEIALENLEMQSNSLKENDSSKRASETLTTCILHEWEKTRNKLNELEDVYKKCNEAIDLWKRLKKQIDQLPLDQSQKDYWLKQEKKKAELLGHTKRACLWEEIENFINSMENLHKLLKF